MLTAFLDAIFHAFRFPNFDVPEYSQRSRYCSGNSTVVGIESLIKIILIAIASAVKLAMKLLPPGCEGSADGQ